MRQADRVEAVRERSPEGTDTGPGGAGGLPHPGALVPTLVLVGTVTAIVSSLGAPLIPTIARSSHVSLSTGEWLLTAALLTGALATPVMGRLADGARQREVILVSLGVVFAGCVLAAVSDQFVVLVAGRALQGIGLGLLPVTMAIARRNLPIDRAGRAIAALSITVAVGAGIGYPVTGLIAEFIDVHAAFWFGALMVAGAITLAALVLPGRSVVVPRAFDAVGAVTLSVVIIGISLVLSEGGSWGWSSVATLGCVVVSALFLLVWIRHELHQDDPLVDLRQVRNRSVLTADVSGFLICVAMYLFLPIVVEFVQVPIAAGYGFGASVVVSSLVFLPLSVGTFAASRCLVAYEARFGSRTMIPLGSTVCGLGALVFALEHRSLWEAFVSAGLVGIGIGLTFAAMPGFIVRAVPKQETGSAMGFYQVLRNIGLSVGSALGAAILTGYTHPGSRLPEVGGFRTALLVAAGLCATTAVISYVLPGAGANQVPAPADTPGEHELEERSEEEAEFAGAGAMLADGRSGVAGEPPTSGPVGRR
jgi:MFS family permease